MAIQGPRIAKAISKKNREGGFIRLNFKPYCEAIACYWCEDKYLNQWDRIENLEKDPGMYGQLIFLKNVHGEPQGEGKSLKQILIGIHKNTNLNPYLTSHTKVILKWITDPNIKTKNIKLLGNGDK